MGKVVSLQPEGQNLHITIESSISNQLKIDQSVAHNGVCLTVIKHHGHTHTVTAISETLQKTNLGSLNLGNGINLERCMQANARLDGHLVQGHVDCTATCTKIQVLNGSHYFTFKFLKKYTALIVNKGSVCVDGVSLTIVEATNKLFSVAIIPYTFKNTQFYTYKVGSTVNIEFDIIGKYVAKLFKNYKQN